MYIYIYACSTYMDAFFISFFLSLFIHLFIHYLFIYLYIYIYMYTCMSGSSSSGATLSFALRSKGCVPAQLPDYSGGCRSF